MFHGRMSFKSVLLMLMNFVSWFRLELMYIFLIKSMRSNLTYLHASSAAIVHRNQFFPLYQKGKSSESKVNFWQEIIAKEFLKLPNLHMLIKQKRPSLPGNWALVTFGKFNKGKSAIYLFYSTTWQCCLKQNCLLKIFLRTLILMTWYLVTCFPFYD